MGNAIQNAVGQIKTSLGGLPGAQGGNNLTKMLETQGRLLFQPKGIMDQRNLIKQALGQFGLHGLGTHTPKAAAPDANTTPIAAPVVMPLPDDAAVQAARKRQAQMMMQGAGGRLSTVLSQPNSDALGG